uniref:Uncharacterized protein n=1 Tax=Arundo donax TaxID=35708 RepID=A0A0A9BC58_ARUDO
MYRLQIKLEAGIILELKVEMEIGSPKILVVKLSELE